MNVFFSRESGTNLELGQCLQPSKAALCARSFASRNLVALHGYRFLSYLTSFFLRRLHEREAQEKELKFTTFPVER